MAHNLSRATGLATPPYWMGRSLNSIKDTQMMVVGQLLSSRVAHSHKSSANEFPKKSEGVFFCY